MLTNVSVRRNVIVFSFFFLGEGAMDVVVLHENIFNRLTSLSLSLSLRVYVYFRSIAAAAAWARIA